MNESIELFPQQNYTFDDSNDYFDMNCYSMYKQYTGVHLAVHSVRVAVLIIGCFGSIFCLYLLGRMLFKATLKSALIGCLLVMLSLDVIMIISTIFAEELIFFAIYTESASSYELYVNTILAFYPITMLGYVFGEFVLVVSCILAIVTNCLRLSPKFEKTMQIAHSIITFVVMSIILAILAAIMMTSGHLTTVQITESPECPNSFEKYKLIPSQKSQTREYRHYIKGYTWAINVAVPILIFAVAIVLLIVLCLKKSRQICVKNCDTGVGEIKTFVKHQTKLSFVVAAIAIVWFGLAIPGGVLTVLEMQYGDLLMQNRKVYKWTAEFAGACKMGQLCFKWIPVLVLAHILKLKLPI